MENIGYLSSNVLCCFEDLFSITYSINEDYVFSLFEISNYLMSNSKKYDYILNNYSVGKRMLINMILANYLEYGYYKKQIGIKPSLFDCDLFKVMDELSYDCSFTIKFDVMSFNKIINDTISYLFFSSPMRFYNVLNAVLKDDFCKKIYKLYPLSFCEHLEVLSHKFTEKEFLLYNLHDCVVDEFLKILAFEGQKPLAVDDYYQKMLNFVLSDRGLMFVFFESVISRFNELTDIKGGISYDKILLVEIFSVVYRIKGSGANESEVMLMDNLHNMSMTIDNISTFYDKNCLNIILSIVDSFSECSYEQLFCDNEMFTKVKKNEVKHLKKRFEF